MPRSNRQLRRLFVYAGLGLAVQGAFAGQTASNDIISVKPQPASPLEQIQTYILKNNLPVAVIPLLPNFKGRKVEVARREVPLEVINKHAPDIRDTTNMSRQYGRVCEIYPMSTRSDEGMKWFTDMIFGRNAEYLPANIREEVALAVFLHESRHCAQNLNTVAEGWEDAGFNPYNEAEADAFAIKTMERLNPQTRIRDIIMAQRALEGARGYKNATILQAMLDGSPIPDPHDVLEAYDRWSFLTDRISLTLARQGSSEDEQVIRIAREMVLLENTESPLVTSQMLDISRARMKAYEFFYPHSTAKAQDVAKAVATDMDYRMNTRYWPWMHDMSKKIKTAEMTVTPKPRIG